MLGLLRSLCRPALVAMEIREVPRPATPTTTGPARPAAAAAAAAPAAPAAAPAGGAQVRDSFSSTAPPKPTQQTSLINPISVAKLSLVASKEMPKELLANVAKHVKDTQTKVGSLIPKQVAAPAKKAAQKKGGRGGKGKGKGGGLFDDGSSEG